MLYLKEAVVKLRGGGGGMDTVSGVHIVMECYSELQSMRNVGKDDYSQRTFEHNSRIAETSGINVTMQQISTCKQHLSDPEYASCVDYFKKTIAIPFLGLLINGISGTSTYQYH